MEGLPSGAQGIVYIQRHRIGPVPGKRNNGLRAELAKAKQNEQANRKALSLLKAGKFLVNHSNSQSNPLSAYRLGTVVKAGPHLQTDAGEYALNKLTNHNANVNLEKEVPTYFGSNITFLFDQDWR